MAWTLSKKVALSNLLRSPQKCFRGRGMIVNVIEAELFILQKHIKDRYTSGLVLTDFESAFLSIFVPWVLHVLEKMK
eukprot:5316226-Pyramimonas_sp.AAC.1